MKCNLHVHFSVDLVLILSSLIISQNCWDFNLGRMVQCDDKLVVLLWCTVVVGSVHAIGRMAC